MSSRFKPLTKSSAVDLLRHENPTGSEQALGIYVDLFFEYHQAQALIDRIGPITADPVSKRPIENPYVRIRDAAARKMDSYRTLRVDALWQAAWKIEHGKKG